MRRAGLIILYAVAIAIGLGGVGDLTIRALFDVHKRFLGTADVPATTTALVLHLLHALGGGLVGIGLASLALVHFGVRRGAGWALWAMLAVSGRSVQRTRARAVCRGAPARGVDLRAIFREMGIEDRWILTPGNNPSEIRKAFQVFSQSAVRASRAASFSQGAVGGFTN